MTFSLEMVIYLLGLAATAGTILSRIAALEKKVERHNKVLERTFRLEEWQKGAERRLEVLAEHMGEAI